MHANSKNSVQFIFQKLVNMYKYNTKSWWEEGVIQDTYMHTRHIYAAPRFVIYNTEKKIKYKVLDQLAPLKLIYPPPHPLHSFFSPQRTLIHLYIKTKSFVHNAPIYNTGKYCCFNCSTFFFVTEINMLLSEQTFIRFEIESCFFLLFALCFYKYSN